MQRDLRTDAATNAIVVGGGFGGVAAALRLRGWCGHQLDIGPHAGALHRSA